MEGTRGTRDGPAAEVVAADALEPADLARLSQARPRLLGLDLDRPQVMGILNVTPDSFSDGGRFSGAEAALRAAQEMVAAGADLLDLGGESTRPGAETVPAAEEIRRVVPVIQAIRDAGIVTEISIDTRKSAVAEAALDAGASMVNDVSALGFDPEMAALVAERGVPLCLMHAKGPPETMQDAPRYGDVLAEVTDFLGQRVALAEEAGILRARLIVDPGIGFGKTQQHNLTLLRGLSTLHDLGLPLLLGASRKRFIGTITGAEAPQARLPGSLAVALAGAAHGAHFLRVHDVLETCQALRMWRAIHEGEADG